ncbi:MAG TPA: hypothetical protein VFP34_16650 [Microlunatus sp.]|nr:hypothetical protein [Microlunatus sp.]
MNRRKLARLGGAVAALAMTTSLVTTTASASPQRVPKTGSSTSAQLGSTSTSGSRVSTKAATAAASGCWGHTHNPHKSAAFASVHGDTDCPYVAPMTVSINLLRWRWYGLQHLAHGSKSGTKSYVNGNAKWYCSGTGTYTYRGESYHRVTVGGKNYVAWTANEDRFSC